MPHHRLASLLAVAAVLALPAAAGAGAPVVPLLTGGEVHWAGTAHREFHQREPNDSGGYYNEDAHSDVSWDSRLLVPGNYADAPSFAIPDGIIFPTAYKTVVGSGASHSDSLDCSGSPDCGPVIPQDCTWTEAANGPGAAPLDDPPGQRYIVGSMGPAHDGRDYSCQGEYNLANPSLFEGCDDIAVYGADVCGTVLTLPPVPAEGDAATISEHFDHSSPDAQCGPADTACPQSGQSTLTVSCALCVTAIHYEQPDLPGRGWADVPPTGTFDGNRVRITATIHNATGKDITAPVRFRDLTTQRDLPVADGSQPPAAQIGFPANGDTQVVLEWNTEGFAWYAPHNADPHKIAVLTPYGGAREDLPVRPKPVLLVHGYNAHADTWDGYPDFFKGVREDWLAQAVAGMNTDPAEGNTLLGNAQILGRAIEKLRNDQDAEHVDLVGHSMGGLISRQYLHAVAPDDPDHRPVVAHLVMLGTPNEGSECAYVAAVTGAEGWPTRQLMPIYLIGTFNRTVTNTKGTKLSVLAGISKAGGFLSNVVCGLPEPNDLVVWRPSAFWTLTDTATQSGLAHIQMTHDATAFSTFVEPHLAVTPDGASRRRVRTAGAARTAAAKAPAPRGGDVAGLAVARHLKLAAHRSGRVAVKVAGGRALAVMVLAPEGVRARLLDQRHKAVASATSDGGFTSLGARAHGHGRWTVVLTNGGARAASASVAVRIDRDPFKVTPSLKRHGKRLALKVSIRGAGGRPRVKAVARPLKGRAKPIRLRRHGARYTAAVRPLRGGTLVIVTVRGRRGTRIAEAAAP
jgi:pimeloyl-ACP methyl ester carboxylesterase